MKHCQKKFSGIDMNCCVQHTDDSTCDRFRKFKTIEETFRAHAILLYKAKNNNEGYVRNYSM